MKKENIKINESAQNIEGAEKNINVLEYNYQRYLELGGIINEEDYKSAIDRMNNTHTLDRNDPSVRASIAQAEVMAEHAGIKLDNLGSTIDRKIILYVLLRLDSKPKDVEYHHGQMSDQNIFVEVLRIFGDADSLDKLIKYYSNISFEYKKER